MIYHCVLNPRHIVPITMRRCGRSLAVHWLKRYWPVIACFRDFVRDLSSQHQDVSRRVRDGPHR